MRPLVVVCAAALLAGCTTAQVGTDVVAERDPLEGVNRVTWGINQGVDKVVLKPVSTVYRTVTPPPLRRGLSRVLANLSEPWSAINNILQGKMKRAGDNLARFVVNTTIGVGGLADQASRLGIKPANEDFGQTLAAWSINSGPYLVVPLIGPSTLRDGVGSASEFFADPYRIGLRNSGLSKTAQYGVTAFEFVSARAELTESGGDAFLKTSLDPYAAAKSAYLQSRRSQILDEGESGDTSDTPALDAAPPGDVPADSEATTPPAPDAPADATPPAADATPPAADALSSPSSSSSAPLLPAGPESDQGGAQ